MKKGILFSIMFVYFLSLLTIHLAEKPLIYDFGILLNFLAFVFTFLNYDLEKENRVVKNEF